MKTFSLNVGGRFCLNGKEIHVQNVIDDEWLEFRKTSNNSIFLMRVGELQKKFLQKKLIAISSSKQNGDDERPVKTFGEDALSSLDEKLQKITRHRIELLRVAAELTGKKNFNRYDLTENVMYQLKLRFGSEKILSSSRLYKLNLAYAKSGFSIFSMVPRVMCRGSKKKRFSEITEGILDYVIEKKYLTEKRLTKKTVYNHVAKEIHKYNEESNTKITTPSMATIYRRIKELRPYYVIKKRYGKEYADKLFRTTGKGLATTAVLERVEIDHTPIDAFVIDDLTNKVIGRPIITLIIDCYSRCVLGYYISIGGTPVSSVKNAIRHAILPKSDLKEKFPNVLNDWPCYGIPIQFILDNGSEFHAISLEVSIYDLRSDASYIPRRAPENHGITERFNQTLNRGVADKLAGKSFYKADKRKDYDSVGNASLTLNQLEAALVKFIVDVYHQRVHRSLGESPINRWKASAANVDIRLPESIDALNFALSDYAECTLTHKGIEHKNNFYNNSELGELRKNLGESVKVAVRHFYNDLTCVYVAPINDQKNYIYVPATNYEELVGVSRYEFDRRRKKIAKQMKLDAAIAEAKFDDELEAEEKKTKLRQRTEDARLKRAQANARKAQNILSEVGAKKPKVLINLNDINP